MADSQNYVGFANFPNQVFRRAIKNGFEFTMMVVGQSGLGKSTFVNTLFLAEINDLNEQPALTSQTMRIEQKQVRLTENGVALNLTLVDTPGFGDQLDNSKCWEPILQYVDSKYLEYFCEETRLERPERVPDNCVHLALYFIEPNGHGLKQLDIEFMTRLHDRVNIIPVIAKADTMTKDELHRFKAQVRRDLEQHKIKLYAFPFEDTEEDKKLYAPLRARAPFAVIGSNKLREEGSRRIRYREYPWGTVEVDNLDHNDFLALRDIVIRTNLVDLIDVTRSVHYENFRLRQMSKIPKAITSDRDPFTQLEEERAKKTADLEIKKVQMEKLFNEKVRDREIKLAEREKRLEARSAALSREVALRRSELERLTKELADLRGGNFGSMASLSMSENSRRVSPTSSQTEYPIKKKKSGTLGLFNRN